MVKRRVRVVKASILIGAALSFFLSILLWFTGAKEQGIFVGLWVPSILSFGAFMLSGGQRQ